jgi:tetratricopeptide (TPR) repeat protein/tRNA A-37 threonylcarbamoyl transferase component Bud32
MPPRTVSHYEVAEKLGQGGMGTVYKARDLRLQRLVALKFLAADLLDSEEARDRFLREGRALSSLSHPHIATVYEVDEAGGVPFLALEFLPRGTLRARIRAAESAGGHLAISDVVRWCADIAEALGHAHRHGVIHRDVKSSNVMFDGEGRAKLTDFGLAKVIRDSVGPASGAMIGTFPYMSPEQVAGGAADHRSDLFSLGVVLYESATGRLPFAGDSAAAMLHAISHAEPPPVEEARQDLPAGFSQVLSRLLAKAPEERYQRAEEVAGDLRALGAPQPAEAVDLPTVTVRPSGPLQWMDRLPWMGRRWWLAAVAAAVILVALAVQAPVRRWLHVWSLPARKHVAVLPFRSIGGDADQQAFCDGLTETLTTALAKYGDLSVVPPTEARRLETATQARREFGVNLVLYGSVQRRQDSVRLILSLIDPERRRQIDSEPIDWPLAQLYELEDAVLGKVGDLLNLVAAQAPAGVLAAGATQLPGAYDAYLRGRGFLYRFDKAGNLERARREFEEAIQTDPKFAAAYVGLAETDLRLFRIGRRPEVLQGARQAAERAAELNPRFANAHMALGAVFGESNQPAAAVRELETALKLDPLDPAAYRELAQVYQSQGRFGEAERTYQRAIAARAGDWQSHSQLGVFYFSQQRDADAERLFKKVVELAPDNHVGYRNLGATLFRLGRNREAEAQFRKSLSLRPSALGYSNLGALLMFDSRYGEAAEVMEQAAQLAPQEAPARFRLWGNLGDAYWLARADPEKSRAAWRRAADIARGLRTGGPADAELTSFVAMYEAKIGNWPEALQSITEALKAAPASATVHYQAGLVYALKGDQQRALAELAEAAGRGYSLNEIKLAPELAALRSAPAFDNLMKRGGRR